MEGSLLLRVFVLLPAIVFASHFTLAQQAPDCPGCNCTIPTNWAGQNLYTAATAPPCDGVANDFTWDVSEFGRFHVTAGRLYTISMCSETADTRIYLTLNTSIPPVLFCDDDGCGDPGGPSMVSFVAVTTGQLRLYVFNGSCATPFAPGTLMTVSITCEQPPPPPNDLPCGALELPLTVPPTILAGDNRTATASQLTVPGTGTPNCQGYQGADLWYTTTVPPSGWIGIQTEELSLCAGAFTLYTADVCDGSFTALPGTCTLVGFTGPASEPALVYDAFSAGLSIGATVYIRYWERNGNENGEFLIHTFDASPIENDEPCGAFPLMISATGEPEIHSTAFATPLAGVTAPVVPTACGGPAGNDVWFVLEVPEPIPDTGFLVETSAGTLSNMAMAWYRLAEGSICGPGVLEELGCNAAQTGADAMPAIHSSNAAPLVAGETIYIRLWTETPWTGTFGIVAMIGTAHDLDDPCEALQLEPTYGCVLIPFSNTSATQTSSSPPGTLNVPAPSCGTPMSDIWFTATVPDSGELWIDTHAGTLSNAGMAVYREVSGSCTGNDLILEEIACALDGSQQGSPDMPYLVITDQEPGATIHIRVWSAVGGSGSFNMCVQQPGPPPGSCYYTLTMNDSGGDGWNGSYVTICVSGDCTDYTVYGSTATVYIGANLGQVFSVSYTAVGGPQDQHYFQITQFGQLVYTSSSPPAVGMVFSETVECIPPPAPWTDCLGAAWICSSTTMYSQPLNYQQDDDLNETNQGCLEGGTNLGYWYVIRMSGSTPPGALAFHLSPMAGGSMMDDVDLDFALWGPYHHPGTGPPGSLTWEGVGGSCPPAGPPIRCSYATTTGVTGLAYDSDLPLNEGSNGSGFVRHLDTQPFEIYLLYVDDRDLSNTGLMLEWISPPPAYEPMASIDCYGYPIPLGLQEQTPSPYNIHPNPNTGQFTISHGGNAALVELRVIDLAGRLVHTSQVQMDASGQHVLDIRVASGIYQLQISDGSETQVHRLMIRK